MPNKIEYLLEDVTSVPALWSDGDPVRPELDVAFKTSPGRGVFGLLKSDGTYKAFLCYALTTTVPTDVQHLAATTTTAGTVVVPYTVWSRERGAGKRIVNKVIEKIRDSGLAERVVTLSPRTEMARNFHLRNGAIELRINETTANFEYTV